MSKSPKFNFNIKYQIKMKTFNLICNNCIYSNTQIHRITTLSDASTTNKGINPVKKDIFTYDTVTLALRNY